MPEAARSTHRLIDRDEASPAGDLRERLRELVPGAFVDGVLDADVLREAIGGEVAEGREERYRFSWAGKRDALAHIQRGPSGTLKAAPEESVDFEQSGNLFIEGENLEALHLLYKPYFGRVKMIYIDPPYNTGNDFVYPDDFADPLDRYLRMTGQRAENGEALTTNPETSGRYHSAWLSMMYPRLFLARQLLREDGVIFVSIDDHEVHNLRMLMNEVFGEENFVANIVWQKMDSPSRNEADRALSEYHDYILVYAREKAKADLSQKIKPEILDAYPLRLEDGRRARARQLRKNGKSARREDRPSMWYPLEAPDGTTVWPVAPEGWEGRWVLKKRTWHEREEGELTKWELRPYGWVPYYIESAPENPTIPWPTIWTDVGQNRQAKAEFTALMESSVDFDNPKPSSLLRNLAKLGTGENDIILDFFAGSCTTAQAVLELNREDGGNRRFIMVQLPEPTGRDDYPTIAEIGKERIRRVIGRMKEEAGQGELKLAEREAPEDLGFRVYELAESNFRSWRRAGGGAEDSGGYAEQMDAMADPLVDGWRAEDVILEIALREGFALNSRTERVEDVPDQHISRVHDPETGQSFDICLDEEIRLHRLHPLRLGPDDRFFCRDAALDDEAAANLALQCRLRTI